ncbi:MAG: hypothetical protein P1S46_06960 [bacterium]|nr:hypothetical protein [bacterium]
MISGLLSLQSYHIKDAR